MQEMREAAEELEANARGHDAFQQDAEECIVYHLGLQKEQNLRAQNNEVQPMLVAWQCAP